MPHAVTRTLRCACGVLFAGLVLAAASAAHAQPADSSAVVRSITILPRTIYDPLPEGRGRGLYAIANRLHVRTRRSTVRSALVFSEGGRWSEAARAETERRLRALSFLIPDTVRAEWEGDSVDVRVVTHDNWTTSPEFSMESGGGQRFGSFAFTERNFLGFGTSLSVSRRHDPVGVTSFASLEDESMFGTHWRTKFVTGTGAAGTSNEAVIELPFWADGGQRSYGASWTREVSDVSLFSDNQLASRLPRRSEAFDAFWATGRRAEDGTIQRVRLAYRSSDQHLGASVLEPGAPPEFAGAAEDLRLRRFYTEASLWRPHYLVRHGVEQMDREEDIDVGRLLILGVGFSPYALGSAHDEGFARAHLGLGADAGAAGFGTLHLDARTRVHDGLRGTLGQADGRWIAQRGTRWTGVLAAQGVAGKDMPADFQLTIGGLTGLRAFPVRELSGNQYWRLNGELRGVARRDLLHVVSLGGAAFWDSARAWGPGSGTEGWHHDVGFGLRLSLPHSSLNAIARFDVAWPIVPDVDGRHGAAFSFGSGQAF